MSLKIGSLIFYEKLKPFFFVFSKFPVLRIQTRKEPKIVLVFSTPHSDPQLLPDPEFFLSIFLPSIFDRLPQTHYSILKSS